MAETETSASRDRDETETLTIFLETRRWYVSRPSRDRDVETETTITLPVDVSWSFDYTRFTFCCKQRSVLRPDRRTHRQQTHTFALDDQQLTLFDWDYVSHVNWGCQLYVLLLWMNERTSEWTCLVQTEAHKEKHTVASLTVVTDDVTLYFSSKKCWLF